MPRGKPAERDARVADRRQRVAAMYLEGRTQWAISRQLKAGIATVNRDLDAIRQEWLHSAMCDYNARKSQELARIDLVEREAWAAWHRSQKEKTTREEEESSGEDSTRRTTKTRAEPRDGSAEYLRLVQWCVEQRCKILGLDSPKQVQFVGAVAVKVEAAPPAGLSADDVRFLNDLADRTNILGPAPAADPRRDPHDPAPGEPG